MKRAVNCVVSLYEYVAGVPRKKARILELEEENKNLRARYHDLSQRCRTDLLRTQAEKKMIEAEVEMRLVTIKLECQRELIKVKLELLSTVDKEK